MDLWRLLGKLLVTWSDCDLAVRGRDAAWQGKRRSIRQRAGADLGCLAGRPQVAGRGGARD